MKNLHILLFALLFFAASNVNAQTLLYSADFEAPTFTPGDINGQGGWAAQFGNWTVDSSNPFEGTQHMRFTYDGFGQTLAFTPLLGPMSFSTNFCTGKAMIDMPVGTGGYLEFIPQSPTAGFVNTRVVFNPDMSIDVLEAPGVFVPTGASHPSGYFMVTVIIDRLTNEFDVYIDETLIFEGQGFAPDIEQIVFLGNGPSPGVGTIYDVDNVEIWDGEMIPMMDVPPIPTMSEWGIIILGFLFMIIGIVSVRQRKTILDIA